MWSDSVAMIGSAASFGIGASVDIDGRFLHRDGEHLEVEAVDPLEGTNDLDMVQVEVLC